MRRGRVDTIPKCGVGKVIPKEGWGDYGMPWASHCMHWFPGEGVWVCCLCHEAAYIDGRVDGVCLALDIMRRMQAEHGAVMDIT